jgi:hypothetical protein
MFTGSRPNWIKVRGDVDKERKTKMEGLRVCLKIKVFIGGYKKKKINKSLKK